MPASILPLLPAAVRDAAVVVDALGNRRVRQSSFLVLDYHPCTLTAQLRLLPRPLPFELLVQFLIDLMQVCTRLSVGGAETTSFGRCDNSVREKIWRSRKCGTQAT